MEGISIKKLNIKYSDDFVAVGDFDLEISNGSLAVICGLCGSGKTSVALALCGLIPYEGDITVNGHILRETNTGERGIGFIPSQLNLFSNLTVRENLEYALKLRKLNLDDYISRLNDVSAICGILKISNKKVKFLTEYERKSVALARLFMRENSLYIIDCEMPELFDILNELKNRFRATVLYLSSYYDKICEKAECKVFIHYGCNINYNSVFCRKFRDPFLNVFRVKSLGNNIISPFGTFTSDLPDGEYYAAVYPMDMSDGNGAKVVYSEYSDDNPYALNIEGISYYLYSTRPLTRLGFNRIYICRDTRGEILREIELK